ncbi:winged helix DNA-binding domain-containing protein [Neobacillus novalis]|uniref:Winged helix DNA-binding domain-containing protein n=2 Tax=Neobacillus novalis TaxID=220687 RepID=A0AA95S9I5_9BACI|nr:winged helix DNA-binding domain-containing protein [Neobacillus novalis]WHY87015.1 winged helix DNA-binding domain-containing protein [Neobacillus novalis]
MLLTRVNIPVLDAIEHLVGIQAQDPNAPYFGLWTRLEKFRPEDLSNLIQDKKVVRLALMRSTIHLVSSQDGMRLRPLVQPVQESGLKSSFGKYLTGLDILAVADAGRTLVETKPRTFSELGQLLGKQWPNVESDALAAVVRTMVPLVQLPPRGIWGKSGKAVHTSSEAWIGTLPLSKLTTDDIILRYLASFGPATIQDIQAWSGLTRLKEKVEQLLPQLFIFHDNDGNELIDIPNAPRPDENTPSPPRFLGGFDNILLSYADRKRIIDETYRNIVFTKNGIIRPTILIDGFVSGIWKVKKEKGTVRLIIELFKKLADEEHNALMDEATRLLDFIEGKESSREILFV